MPKKYTIPEHWDTSGEITATSNPKAEFELWFRHAARNPDKWTGEEFGLSDFEAYIESLKPTEGYTGRFFGPTDQNEMNMGGMNEW